MANGDNQRKMRPDGVCTVRRRCALLPCRVFLLEFSASVQPVVSLAAIGDKYSKLVTICQGK